MSRSLILEDFSRAAPSNSKTPSQIEVPPPANEADTLDAYDNGYKSGWADCAAAEAEERLAIGADLAKHVSEAQLTYEQAKSDVLTALTPFFDEFIATLLPRLAAEAVAPVALDELGRLVEQQADAKVELIAAPSVCPSIQRLVEGQGLDGVSVRPEPAYSESQVSLRAGVERREIDLSQASERIASAIRDFQSQIEDPGLIQGAA